MTELDTTHCPKHGIEGCPCDTPRYDVDYSTLPTHMQMAARRYIEEHKLPGDFLQAVLRNDLSGAFAKADLTNRAALQTWVEWLWNEAPGHCWGSKEKVDAWVEGYPQ